MMASICGDSISRKDECLGGVSVKIQEVKEALSSLLGDIAHCDAEYSEDEARSWLMAATLRIWAGNRLFSEDYVKLLPVFRKQDYTAAQVITALNCAGDESREMAIPVFFQIINDIFCSAL